MRVALAFAAALLTGAPQPPSIDTPNAIAGRVVDGAGKPVQGVVITLVTAESRAGQRVFHPSDVRLRAVTNPQGEYRLNQIPLGEHYVVAIPQNAPVTGDGRINRNGYAITYYPSAPAASSAGPVVVTVKGPATADITLRAVALNVVSGTVFGSDGKPVNAGTLGVAHGDNLFGVDGKGYRIRADGGFVIPGLAPGTYFLHFREGVWPPPRDVIPRVSVAKVILAGTDAAGVRVVPVQMVRGTGRLIVDASVRDKLPADMTVSATPVSFDGNPGPQRAGTVQPDLTFEFRTWPGPGKIRVFPEDSGWNIKSVRYKGTDVTATGIDFVEGTDITGIEVELTRGPGGRMP